MMKTRIVKYVFLFSFILLGTFVFTSNVSAATSPCGVLGGSGGTGGSPCTFTLHGVPSANCSTLNSTIGEVVTLLFFIAGLVFFVMIVISGLKMMTSGGDREKFAGARSSLVYAIIGIVIVAGSFLIVEVVFGLLHVNGSIFTSSPINSNCSIK
ncbi:MAG: pilin [Patescibacteria group bacterium]